MKKVKSVKFYNFTNLTGASHGGINVYFFDCYGKLMMIDMSSPITYDSTYCETDKYIVTANGSYSGDQHSLRQAFHTGNVYRLGYLTRIGCLWIPPGYLHSESDYIKFEFKIPMVLSDIQVLHSYHSACGFNTCDYEVIYDDESNYKSNIISDGKLNKFSSSETQAFSYDQSEYDAQFMSIDFDSAITEFTTGIALLETNDINSFRNINKKIKNFKCLYEKPANTYIKFLISFDNRNTWNNFDGNNFIVESDISQQNIFENGIDIDYFDLVADNLITNNFMGNIDFRIILKTDDENISPSITKIYIEME